MILPVLLGVCWCVKGVTFSLRGESISTSGDVMLNISDIRNDNANALLCQSEMPSSEVDLFPNWYIDPNGTEPDTSGGDATRLRRESFVVFGWDRERTFNNNDNPQLNYLRRQSPIALEGYFTCDIGGDTNTPRGLFILYPLSMPTISVISRGDGTYTVNCTVTGGRLSSSSLTGPGLGSSGLSLPTMRASDRGKNTYSRTSGTLSEDVGSVYTCTVMNDVSSPETSLTLTAAGDPTLEELVLLSLTAVRVTWSQPSEGATVTGYTVHYTRDDGTARRISNLPPSTTTTDIPNLTSNRIYTISVEATATNSLSGESEERTISLRIDPPGGVMVTAVEPASVRVSWQSVENADSYTITFTKATGDDQEGLCRDATHTANVSVTTTSATIAVGLDVESDVRDMLRAYTTYFITVVAVSEVLGTGRVSDPVEHTTIQRDAAEAPSNVRATVEGSTNISVRWGAIPTCRLVNGLIVKYRVEYTANGRTQSTEEATDDPRSGAETTLTGLTPFTTYSIRVAGVNEEGDIGVYSDPITEQTEESTPGPVVITAEPSLITITITWGEPAMPNGIITDYEVSFWRTDSPDSATASRTGLETSFTTPDDLEPGTSFTFTVRAFTSVGPGDITTIAVSTLTRPPAVQGVTVTPLTDTSVTVSWSPVVIPNPIETYTVVYSPVSESRRRQDGEMTAEFPGSVTSGVITDLDPALSYQFQVFATITVDGVSLEGERSTVDIIYTCMVNTASETSMSSTTPIIIGVVIGIIGVAVGASGLIIAAVAVRKPRQVTGEGGKLTGVTLSTDANPAYGLSSPSQTLSTDANPAYGLSSPSQTLSTDANPAYGLSLSPSQTLSTDANPAYGLSSPSQKHGEGQSDYEMPQPRPATATAPEETVYESGVF